MYAFNSALLKSEVIYYDNHCSIMHHIIHLQWTVTQGGWQLCRAPSWQSHCAHIPPVQAFEPMVYTHRSFPIEPWQSYFVWLTSKFYMRKVCVLHRATIMYVIWAHSYLAVFIWRMLMTQLSAPSGLFTCLRPYTIKHAVEPSCTSSN
jgi:hypothetical protein